MQGRADIPIPIFIGFGVLVVVLVIVSLIAAGRRREAFRAFAARHGFTYLESGGWFSDGNLSELTSRFGDFSPFGSGHSQSAANVVFGQREGIEWWFCDYTYKTGSGKNQTTYTYGVAACIQPIPFLQLEIRGEGFFDRIGQAVGIKDIQFESEEFNRKYHVTSPNPQFAYDILHPQAMEFLMRYQPRHWQFRDVRLMLENDSYYDPMDLERLMIETKEFLDLVPDYVKQDMGARS